MSQSERTELVRRNVVLGMLSRDEITVVARPTSAARLQAGEAYLELERLGRGVRRFSLERPPAGHVLCKSGLHESTWGRILSLLASPTRRDPL